MERVLQTIKGSVPKATSIWFDETHIFVKLDDGRIIGNPLTWYPKLLSASASKRASFEIWGDGQWLHWEDLDEDLSVVGFFTFSPGTSQSA